MESDEIVDPFNLGTGHPTCTIGNNADVLLDGPIQLYHSEPTEFTAMDTTESQTRRWDRNAATHSQALFRLGDENVVVREGFTSFDQVIFSPYSNDGILFDTSEEPSSYTNDKWNIQLGSLPDHSTQSTQIRSHLRQISQPQPSIGRTPRARRPTRHHEDYPTPPTSLQNALDEDDERHGSEYESGSDEYKPPTPQKSLSTSRKPVHKPPTQRTKIPTIAKRHNNHTPGINRQTGELTLIGRFPPLLLGEHLYACPHCYAPDERSSNSWGTRNGYKYHLQHVCLGNPDSTASEKVRDAGEPGLELVRAARKKDVLQQCDVCEAWFKSEAGYKAHRETNVTTRDGLCRTKGRGRGRGLVEGQSPEDEMWDQDAMEYEAGGVPQMVPYEMGAVLPMHGFEETDYYVWRAAFMVVHPGRMEQLIVEGPEPDIQPEAEE
jgi:hypothetical protein